MQIKKSPFQPLVEPENSATKNPTANAQRITSKNLVSILD